MEGTVEASLRLIDELDREIDACEAELGSRCRDPYRVSSDFRADCPTS